MRACYRLWNGYLRIRLTGFSPERFLNLCMANQIAVWDLRCVDGEYQFLMTVRDFRRVKHLVRKAQVHLKILGRYGLPFFLYRNRRRKLYGAGVAVFFLILFLMSRFIWSISIEGNQKFTDDRMIHDLESWGIRYGMVKSGIDCENLEEAIRSHYPEILWVSARVSGTRLLIRVKENEVIGSIPEREHEPGDLVAAKDGTVTRMIVRKGKALVEPGEEVVKGQVLISGEIPILDDAGEPVKYQYVRADGDIYARTYQTYQERLPVLTSRRVKTGKIRKGVRLQIGPLSFLWMLPDTSGRQWELTSQNRQVVLMRDFYLPVWIELIRAEEYSLYEREWSEAELEEQKKRINTQKIQNLMQKGVQIIENNVRILNKNSFLEIDGTFVLEEPIGIRQNMNREEENELLDECN
ncbi:MAG: sporulation protein YqfD [Lachnospiraceae bacterium]|nr:sporulation protein YqfD [Lachnospiraceae bacterium]